MLYPSDTQVVEIMKSTSSCKLLVYLWLDHPGQVASLIFCRFLCELSSMSYLLSFSLQTVSDALSYSLQPTTSPKEEGKKKKKGGGKTVSSVYLVSLGELMVETPGNILRFVHI